MTWQVCSSEYRYTLALTDYATTTAGIVGYTKALAKQSLTKGVRVNVVAPGPLWTGLQTCGSQTRKKVMKFSSDSEYGRADQPVEIAPMYVLTASQEAASSTASSTA